MTSGFRFFAVVILFDDENQSVHRDQQVVA